ncbi:MAG: hypothetical protein JXN59_10340, partial [Anaerolineae bacterium]|nr:hypothetical protein [Anaerolineae bacterium]
QRTVSGDHFVIEGRGSDFDTLWSLKVLQLADQRGILNGLVDHNQLRQLAGRVIAGTPLDKDLALALRLRRDLAGQLRQTQLQALERLLLVAEQTGGVWGLDQDMLWVSEYMRQQKLTAGDVAAHRDVLREMILSTCYVIENLMPLAADYPPVEPALNKAMTLWWGVFHGPHASTTLQTLFPAPYDHLMVLVRTLVAVRAYIGEPLIQWGQVHMHRRMADQELQQAANPDQESIRTALRNWLRVDLEDAPERLHLGMSDSDIVRVKPRVWNPMLPDDSGQVHIPYADSLIVKFGPTPEVDQERENYRKLPNSIRSCFAALPEPTYIDDRGRAFMIMQDLNRYRTLDEMLWRVPQARPAINAELGPFLQWMHEGQIRKATTAPYGLLWELYLLPMQSHIGRIFAYIQDNGLLEQRKLEAAHELKQQLLGLMGDLVTHQLRLEGFPISHMHGDLHTRNIMVRRLRQRERGDEDNELDFKLIDLEKFRLDGDAAMDGGELLADLWLAMQPLKGASDRRPLEELVEAVEASYLQLAAERGDELFPVRLRLAQARSLIRVAKGRTKAGYAALRESRRSPAINVAYEVLDLAGEGIAHLQSVLEALA